MLDAATASANDAQMLCEDIAQQLFPRAQRAPSEAILASTRLILQNLVQAIEAKLGISSDVATPLSWDMLSRSGLLREAALLEFALARMAEHHISQRVETGGAAFLTQLPNRLLESDDPLVAECARKLLIAQNAAQIRSPESFLRQLPADVLHLLVWRVVAVFQMDGSRSAGNLIASGNQLLAAHDEAAAVHATAAKLVYFLPEEERGSLLNPKDCGLALYASGLAHDYRLPHDRILRFIDEQDVAPLLLMLRGRGHEAQAALAIVQHLRGRRSDDHLLPDLLVQYEALDPEAARSEVLGWRLAAAPVWKAG